jgi:hypothetical protein
MLQVSATLGRESTAPPRPIGCVMAEARERNGTTDAHSCGNAGAPRQLSAWCPVLRVPRLSYGWQLTFASPLGALRTTLSQPTTLPVCEL